LDLTYNKLVDLQPTLFDHLEELDTLLLGGNVVTNLTSDMFKVSYKINGKSYIANNKLLNYIAGFEKPDISGFTQQSDRTKCGSPIISTPNINGDT
jgi:hypothetical protein